MGHIARSGPSDGKRHKPGTSVCVTVFNSIYYKTLRLMGLGEIVDQRPTSARILDLVIYFISTNYKKVKG
jgi:hypothetical protein